MEKKNEKLLTSEIRLKRKSGLNKVVLGTFLLIAVIALIMKIVDGALNDFGYGLFGEDKVHIGYWLDLDILKRMSPTDPAYDHTVAAMVEHHPNTFWLLTQFTWITTIGIIIFLTFRFFKYDDVAPRWLKWIMSQRALSLMAMYETIVSVVFWASMFQDFQEDFNPSLKILELTYTILVHGVVPLLFLSYSIIFLIKDEKASILKEMTVWKGMIYPITYLSFYLLVSMVWSDPYPISSFHTDFIHNIWKIPVAIIVLYIFIGMMILFHNLILLKFNKSYDPKNDYDIVTRRKTKIEQVKNNLIRKRARNWRNKKK